MANNNITIIAGVVVIIIIIAIAALALYHPAAKSSSGGSSNAGGSGKGNSGNNSTVSTTATSGGAGQYGGGPGKYYMSESEVSALVGSGGVYNASGNANASIVATYVDQYDKNNSGIFTNNVTAMWIMSYDLNQSKNNTQGILEMVFQSPVAATLYAKSVSNSTSYNVTNAAVNGLKYSYASSSAFFKASTLTGYKDNYMVDVIDIGGVMPQAQLASTVAADLP